MSMKKVNKIEVALMNELIYCRSSVLNKLVEDIEELVVKVMTGRPLRENFLQ